MNRYGVAVALLALAVLVGVAGNLTAPLAGAQDIGQWLHLGRQAADQVQGTPWPVLDLGTADGPLPYPQNPALQPWSFERDAVVGGMLALAGPGPWVQWYYVASLLLVVVGARLIAGRELGPHRAWLLGAAAALANGYALLRFPAHANIAACHWLVLCVLVDVLICRRLAVDRAIAWPLVRWRLALTGLCAGLEPAYVCATALTTGLVTGGWLAALVVWRCRQHGRRWRCWWRTAQRRISALSRRGWVGLASVGLWTLLLLPSLIALVAQAGDVAALRGSGYWTAPWRLLMPMLPWTADVPGGDMPEFPWDGSPGLGLLLAAVIALICLRGRAWLFLPIVTLIAASACLVPGEVGLWSLPWHQAARVGPRALLIVAPLCAAVAIACWPQRPIRWLRWAAVPLLLLVVAEATTAAWAQGFRLRPVYQPTAQLLDLYAQVQRSPGRSILDVPSSIIAGNGVGVGYELLPRATDGMAAERVFHGKLTSSAYRGRATPLMVAAHQEAGWTRWMHLVVDGPPPWMPTDGARQRCREAADFAAAYLAAEDGAGLLVRPGLVHPQVLRAIIDRFGRPVAAASQPTSGGLWWIPWRAPAIAPRPHMPPPALWPGSVVIPGQRGSDELLGEGWHTLEDGRVWSSGRRAGLVLRAPDDRPALVNLTVDTFAGQSAGCEVGGHPVPAQASTGATTTFQLQLPAGGTLRPVLTADHPSSPKAILGTADTRILGLGLLRIVVE
jgi:hypothetical protein